MGPQSRLMSHVESLANIVIGIGIQAGANALLIPLLFAGATMAAKPLFWLTVVMTVLSWVRSFGVRRLFESVRTRHTPPDFQSIIEEIAAERWRQIEGEGFHLEDDDHWTDGRLARGAGAYAYWAGCENVRVGERPLDLASLWPTELGRPKPGHMRRALIKSAAMIVAEIGRIDRAARRGASK